MSELISRNLAVALLETINDHAETYHGGKMDLHRALHAIGDLASGLIAEIDNAEDCAAHWAALVNGMKAEVLRKRNQDGEVRTRQ